MSATTKQVQYLRYLFGAELSDGSVFEQTPEDISTADPLRSCFYDLVQIGLEKVRVFWLCDARNHRRVISLDLKTGEFETGGMKFQAGDPRVQVEGPRRLIFFRRHLVDIELESDSYEDRIAEYHLGWQATGPQGENVQVTVGVQ